MCMRNSMREFIINVDAQKNLEGHTLADLGVGPKGKEGIAALLVRRGNEIIITPSTSEVAKAGDVLILAGADDRLESFLTKAGQSRPDRGEKE